MNGRTRLTAILAAIGAIAVFAGLLFVVGAGRVVDALFAADPLLIAATLGVAVCWLAAWGLMLRTVLGTLDVSISPVSSFFVYSGAMFANNVTPFGQAGGEPVAALVISKVTDSRYETGLAGIASVDVLNVIPSVSLIVVGVGYYATTAALGQRLETALTSGLFIMAGIVLVVAFLWSARAWLVDRLPAAISGVAARIGRSRVDPAALEESIAGRLEGFVENVERVATDRLRLTAVLGLSLAGWLLQAVALLVAFLAVGHSIPFYVAIFVIPLANLAGAAPLPGGLGGIEAAFVALLVPTTGVAASAVTAAVLIFRGAVYWQPVLIGGAAVSAYGVRSVR
ncbi:lysylphosphatidylglycerol synthase transmembrane domain-containing protein [Halovivax limisalsi]|uniref:lysylphosphatidylglycerol synthase transmembrane domain-containing protein n=1 Tax=Halovivax limisalsi TaxID=1453760 RepID=UPI001FFD1B16|nr:flippase-like domain-containing protein [Halovivax limisalsi]